MKHIKTFNQLSEGLSANKEEYTFSSGLTTTTDKLTYQASQSSNEDDFIAKNRIRIAAFGNKDLSTEDEEFLRDFYERFKGLKESVNEDKNMLFPQARLSRDIEKAIMKYKYPNDVVITVLKSLLDKLKK
jgi:hypothetical protein